MINNIIVIIVISCGFSSTACVVHQDDKFINVYGGLSICEVFEIQHWWKECISGQKLDASEQSMVPAANSSANLRPF